MNKLLCLLFSVFSNSKNPEPCQSSSHAYTTEVLGEDMDKQMSLEEWHIYCTKSPDPIPKTKIDRLTELDLNHVETNDHQDVANEFEDPFKIELHLENLINSLQTLLALCTAATAPENSELIPEITAEILKGLEISRLTGWAQNLKNRILPTKPTRQQKIHYYQTLLMMIQKEQANLLRELYGPIFLERKKLPVRFFKKLQMKILKNGLKTRCQDTKLCQLEQDSRQRMFEIRDLFAVYQP